MDWEGVATYVYDETNHMVDGKNELGERSLYTYNGLGIRVGRELIMKDNTHGYTDFHKETPSVDAGIPKAEVSKESYVIDYTSPTFQTLVMGEEGGFEYRWVYGLDKLSVKITSEGTNWWAQNVKQDILKDYLHQDRMGSTTNLTDQFGRVVGRADYNEWGQITYKDALDITSSYRRIYPQLSYTGHDWDDVLGMYYAKARFYDADTKRFVALDPVKGNVTDPLSLVPYIYCVDNPLRWVDPLGLTLQIPTQQATYRVVKGGIKLYKNNGGKVGDDSKKTLAYGTVLTLKQSLTNGNTAWKLVSFTTNGQTAEGWIRENDWDIGVEKLSDSNSSNSSPIRGFGSAPDEKPAYTDNEREGIAAKKIRANAENILCSSRLYGVDPQIIAGVIYVEQYRNYNWIDSATDWIAFYGFDMSVGLGQVRMTTAEMLENEGYVPKTGVEGGWNLPFGIWISGNVTQSREKRLEDDRWNITYVAAYIRYFIDTWEEALPEISNRPDILGTLYNIGQRTPRTDPEANGFGERVKHYYNLMACLLGL